MKKSLLVSIYFFIYLFSLIIECLLFENKGEVFWICQFFSAFATILVLSTYFLVQRFLKKQLYSGIALTIVSNIYFIAQMALAFDLIINNCNVKRTVIIELIPLFIYIVIGLCIGLGKNIIDAFDRSVEKKISYLRMLEKRFYGCKLRCEDPELRNIFSALIEKIHYSDPMSPDFLENIEREMMVLSQKIANEIGDIDLAKDDCDKFEKLLAERNYLCKTGKRE